MVLVLHEGDTFKDAGGTVLGQWRINAGYIEVVLGAGAEGNSSISAQFLTGKNALANNTILGVTQNVTVGGIVKSIKFSQRVAAVLTGDDAKGFSSDNTLTYPMASLAANETITFSFAVTVDEGIENGVKIENIAAVEGMATNKVTNIVSVAGEPVSKGAGIDTMPTSKTKVEGAGLPKTGNGLFLIFGSIVLFAGVAVSFRGSRNNK